MLYCAHLSFDGRHSSEPLEGRDFHGRIDCLVEADRIEVALQQLRSLLRERHRRGDFSDISSIYLDALIEVNSLPKKGVVTFFAKCLGEIPATLSTSLPGTRSGYCNSYTFGREENEGGEEGSEVLPFLEFGD